MSDSENRWERWAFYLPSKNEPTQPVSTTFHENKADDDSFSDFLGDCRFIESPFDYLLNVETVSTAETTSIEGTNHGGRQYG